MAILNAIFSPVGAVVGKIVGEIIYDGKKIPAELQKKRLFWCNACPHLLVTGQCTKCLCFVKEKVKYHNQECPLKKWKKVNI